MHFWRPYPFIRFSIAFILGILLSDRLSGFNNIYLLVGILVLVFAVTLQLATKYGFYKLRLINGILGLTIILFLGIWITNLKHHSYPLNHYSRHKEIRIDGFEGIISSSAYERPNYYRYDFELSSALFNDSLFSISGKIHLYVKKDSALSRFNYGERLLISGHLYPIASPGNPHEFNYPSYLKKQQVFAHTFLNQSQLKQIGIAPPSHIVARAFQLRQYCNQIIDRLVPQTRENAILKAILLGIKDHLDNDIKKAYSSAGAMHVLAVSGLHVGIIYLLLQLSIGKIRTLGRYGKWVFGLFSIGVIWNYAMITGMSPSVMRSATMFSLITISQINEREGNIYNTLGFAAFVLLIYDPYLIYSVGFQLSFAAVFGIVYLHPKLYNALSIGNIILDKAWSITCVSIAAQIATFPITTFYFHQFPTYFLLSNLIIIPAAFILLIGGIGMFMLYPIFQSIAEWIGEIIYLLIWSVNELIYQIESLPHSLIDWIYMDKVELMLTYCMLLLAIFGLHFKSFKTVVLFTLTSLLLLSWHVKTYLDQTSKHQIIFYNIKEKTAIDYVKGHQALLYLEANHSQELDLYSYQINPFRLASHLPPLSDSINSFQEAGFINLNSIRIGAIANNKILLMDSTSFHLHINKPIQSDILIINNESVKNFKWLFSNFPAKHYIIGNSNSISYARRLKNQANQHKIPIHFLKEDGAWIMDVY